ncbi:MAG: MurR/RpiR family transcriptional regulator [Mycoplasma sp.]
MFDKNIIINNLYLLTPKEKKVAHYAMDKGFTIIETSINNIVKETGSSLATINRTFAKMGFTGYKYYKMFLFSQQKEKIMNNSELEHQRKYLFTSLENFYSSFNEDTIDEVVQLLTKNKESVTFLAQGFSLYVANFLSAKMRKIGYDIRYFDDHLYSGALKSKVIFIVSSTLQSESLKKRLKMLKNINPDCKLIVLTNNSNIKYHYDYDYVLCAPFIDDRKTNSKELPSDGIILLMSLCNLIFSRIYERNKEENDILIQKIRWF